MASLSPITPGERFGRLVVTRYLHTNHHKKRVMECLCDCGKTTAVVSGNLRNGGTTSCGCLHREQMSAIGKSRKTHGASQKDNPNYSEWICWQSMWSRCTVESRDDWHTYGGRGISVCERWKSFAAFLSDMGKRPSCRHSIDRIDTNGNYTPENCRWATCVEQNRNRRSNLVLEHDGKSMCLEEWAEVTGLNAGTINARLSRGWTVASALSSPLEISQSGETNNSAKLTEAQVREIHRLAWEGNRYLYEIGADYGISKAVVCAIKNKKTWKHLWQ